MIVEEVAQAPLPDGHTEWSHENGSVDSSSTCCAAASVPGAGLRYTDKFDIPICPAKSS
jgi:hypothetical protein